MEGTPFTLQAISPVVDCTGDIMLNIQFEIWGRDSTGEVVKKRWPNSEVLAQTVKQFLDCGLLVEVKIYRRIFVE